MSVTSIQGPGFWPDRLLRFEPSPEISSSMLRSIAWWTTQRRLNGTKRSSSGQLILPGALYRPGETFLRQISGATDDTSGTAGN
ncbi:MAG: hypothetical protein ACK2UO_01275 [Caldilineaceae bacterium]